MQHDQIMPFYNFLKSMNVDPQTVSNYHKSFILFIEFHLLHTNLYTDDYSEFGRIDHMQKILRGIKRVNKEAHESYRRKLASDPPPSEGTRDKVYTHKYNRQSVDVAMLLKRLPSIAASQPLSREPQLADCGSG
jgi:hypothetical protein